MKLRFWWCFLCWLVCMPLAHAKVLELSEADFWALPVGALPTQAVHSTPVALPDRWRDNHRPAQATGWYRFRFNGSDLGSGVQAVYIPHASVNAVVRLNGTVVGSGGNMEEPISRTWNRPRLYTLPPNLLRPQGNELLVQLIAHPYTQASLYPPRLGDQTELQPLYEDAYFLRITLNQLSSLMVGVVGLLMLNMWWRRRQDTGYGFFAASAIVWALQSSNLYVQHIPVSTALWEVGVNASFQLFAALLLMSMLRFVGASWRPLDLLLWLLLGASPLLMALAPEKHFFTVTAALHMGTLVAAVGAVGLLGLAAFKLGNRDARMLLLTMGLIVLFAAHDWLLHSQHLWSPDAFSWLPGELYLLQYSAPAVFLTLAWIMTVRYVKVLNEFEHLNVELDQRVQAKHAQLETSFEQLRQLERDRAAAEERERIHRDLHDDVGAKLLSLVYKSENPKAADLARSALQDLRDVVSRSSSSRIQLDDLLADIRAEMQQRLADAGVALDWHEGEDLPNVPLTQASALDLTRLMREATSNVIHHASAHNLRVSWRCINQSLKMELIDDGVGAPKNPRQGRGTRNMDARAAALGGALERFSIEPKGFGLRLILQIKEGSTWVQT